MWNQAPLSTQWKLEGNQLTIEGSIALIDWLTNFLIVPGFHLGSWLSARGMYEGLKKEIEERSIEKIIFRHCHSRGGMIGQWIWLWLKRDFPEIELSGGILGSPSVFGVIGYLLFAKHFKDLKSIRSDKDLVPYLTFFWPRVGQETIVQSPYKWRQITKNHIGIYFGT